MSRSSYLSLVRSELRKVNASIDRKVITGKPYANEAKAHAKLVKLIRNAS